MSFMAINLTCVGVYCKNKKARGTEIIENILKMEVPKVPKPLHKLGKSLTICEFHELCENHSD